MAGLIKAAVRFTRSQVVRVRPAGSPLHTTAMHSPYSQSPRSPSSRVLGVRTYASTSGAPEQPQVLDSETQDEKSTEEYIASVRQCNDAAQLQKLVKDKDFNSQSGVVELGHVMRRLRQIDDAAKVPWGRRGTYDRLARQLCHETKRCMPKMLPRTIANSLHYLQGLASLDKLLLANTAVTVSMRVAKDATAFKVTEIAQICRACSRFSFTNKKLNTALAKNILSLDDAELNPRAVLNILAASHKMGLTDPEVARYLMVHLAKNVGMLEVYDLPRVALPASRLLEVCPIEATRLLNALQYTICRQRPNSMRAMPAAILLRDLAGPGQLQAEAAHTLISIVQQEKTVGKALGGILQAASPALKKMGYQVSTQSSFSDLKTKETNADEGESNGKPEVVPAAASPSVESGPIVDGPLEGLPSHTVGPSVDPMVTQ